MAETPAELFIELSLEGGDVNELYDLTRQLRGQVEELNVDSIEQVSAGAAPAGTKSAELSAFGQMVVTLAPALIPSLFDLLERTAML